MSPPCLPTLATLVPSFSGLASQRNSLSMRSRSPRHVMAARIARTILSSSSVPLGSNWSATCPASYAAMLLLLSSTTFSTFTNHVITLGDAWCSPATGVIHGSARWQRCSTGISSLLVPIGRMALPSAVTVHSERFACFASRGAAAVARLSKYWPSTKKTGRSGGRSCSGASGKADRRPSVSARDMWRVLATRLAILSKYSS
mmetsp:Transcript_4165/g.13347  ORF Transcript_4165/g.13347 Transcript_4165/m.13347 type:complete len:202 (-) Transcript_4165:849-1454(-)